jgi:Amt family ammonium transporter
MAVNASSSVDSVETGWVLSSAFNVFFMQLGFSMLETGHSEVKNAQNVITKNILDSCCAGFIWWVLGYGLAFGSSSWANPVVGFGDFMLIGTDDSKLAEFMFQYAFAASCSTIFGGAVAGRMKFVSYITLTVVTSGLLFPLAAHWVHLYLLH